ncbi:MAG TPA: GNAT family N-acetyltransferase, partial [Casimicrobiaceae bacterium]
MLAGPHARFATGAGDVRRYARGFSPIVAFADPTCPDFTALANHVGLHEPFYCEGPDASVPDGWRIEAETTMFKMYWDAGVPDVDEAPDAVRLGTQHAGQALELATMTRPGPFGPR